MQSDQILALLGPINRHRFFGPVLAAYYHTLDMMVRRWSRYDIPDSEYYHHEPSGSVANQKSFTTWSSGLRGLLDEVSANLRVGGETVLFHTRVLQDVVEIFCGLANEVDPTYKLDYELLRECARLHDDGEAMHAIRNGGSGVDVLSTARTGSEEEEEYRYFIENRIRPLQEAGLYAVATRYQRAYALSLVSKLRASEHGATLRDNLWWLEDERPEEVQVWIDIERLDYVASAIFTLLLYPDRIQARRKFVQTLNLQSPRLEERAVRTPRLRSFISEHVWDYASPGLVALDCTAEALIEHHGREVFRDANLPSTVVTRYELCED